MASRSSTTSSGGRPPWERPRSIEPRHGWKRTPSAVCGVHLDGEQVAGVVREEVVVVGARRAARERKRGETRARGRALHRVVDLRPDRVQRHQPAEQALVLGEPPCRPLVQVVMAVDQPGRREQPAAFDAPVGLALGCGRPRPPRRSDRPRARGDRSGTPAPASSTVAIAQPSITMRSLMSDPCARPRDAPRRGSSRTRCSGTGCRPAPRVSRSRPDPASATAARAS